MNRREFSAATVFVLAAAAFGLPGAGVRPGQEAARKGPTTRSWTRPLPVDAPARQGRGRRVLLVRLPALQCVRAPPGSLAEEDAARHRVQARAGGVPGRFRAAAAPVLLAGGHGQGRRDARQSVQRHPQQPRGAQPRGPDRGLDRQTGPGHGQVQGAVQLLLGLQQGPPRHPVAGCLQGAGRSGVRQSPGAITSTAHGRQQTALQVIDYLVADARKSR